MNQTKTFSQIHFPWDHLVVPTTSDQTALEFARTLLPTTRFVILKETGFGPRLYLKPISTSVR